MKAKKPSPKQKRPTKAQLRKAEHKQKIVAEVMRKTPQYQIAIQLGISEASVSRLLKEATAEATERAAESADLHRHLAIETAETVRARGLEMLDLHDEKGGSLALRANDQLAKLLGLTEEDNADERTAALAATVAVAMTEIKRALGDD